MSISSVLSAKFKLIQTNSFKLSPTHPLSIFLISISLILFFLAALLFIFQSKLVYLPQMPPGSREEVWLPSKFGYGPGKTLAGDSDSDSYCDSVDGENCKWEEVEIVTVDKVKLQAFWIKAPSTWTTKRTGDDDSHVKSRFTRNQSSQIPFTILYMQANAGNIGHRLPIARKLQETVDCNIMMISYRGYGKSTGSPSEYGIKIDSQAALDFVWTEKLESEEERNKVIVYGQSIGGAVAINLAYSNPKKISYLIVENTFLSIPKLIPRVAPLLRPFAFLCTQRWNSIGLIPNITQKALFLSGTSDELIPSDHMTQLHQSAKRCPYKHFVSFPKGTHNDTCIQEGYFEAIEEFLTKTPKTPKVTVEEVTDDEEEFMIKGKFYSDKSRALNAKNNNNSNTANKNTTYKPNNNKNKIKRK